MRSLRWWAVVATLGVVLAWLLWSRFAGAPVPASAPPESGAISTPGPASLSPAPAGKHKEPSATPQAPASDGLAECEVHVTTFGVPAHEVEIQEVVGRAMIDAGKGTVRVRTKAGEGLGLRLRGAAVSYVRIDVPDPVPPRIEVRVPAQDDPRLSEPVLLVVDEVTGKPLPEALLEPASKAPDARPIPADAEGRIRVPRALADRIGAYAGQMQSGIVTERNHFPRAWTSLAGMSQASQGDWIEWDATGAMRVRLEPFPSDRPVPRRTIRIVDEDGNSGEGRLVLMRYPSMVLLMLAPVPARTDTAGLAEVVVPQVAAYDVWDGGCLVGTYVMAMESMPEDGRREIRVPKVVRVHVVVRGLEEPKPAVWLRGPEVESLEPDDRTGWARIDGVVVPGWKMFPRAEGILVQTSEGLPCEMDVLAPRDKPVALIVAGREAVLRAQAPTTIEIDWTTLPPPRAEPGSWGWSPTREGLDEAHPSGPSASTVSPAKK